jgi:hypothetical protein
VPVSQAAPGKKLVDLTAPYQNNGKVSHKIFTGDDVVVATGGVVTNASLAGEQLQTGKDPTAVDHRKFHNGKDVSTNLAHAAPVRDKDLHPSNTYVGDGDEVAEDEWD